jgi:alkylation response protein AidB-like acyl-CoA dehydrogenase
VATATTNGSSTVIKPDHESGRKHFIFTQEHEDLRESLRSWVVKELHPHRNEWEDTYWPTEVMRRAGELGFLGLCFPEEYGGQGGDYFYSLVRAECMSYSGSGGTNMGFAVQTDMVLPPVHLLGTEEQKQRYLVPGIKGEKVGCLGITEPGAGSDVAGIRTTAIRDGDEYVVNGQKIWISTAHLADWGLFLLRTDPEAIERGAKHEGITAFIINMHTPGIECRPIRDIAGDELFNEVWFTDARVPGDWRLGEEGQGWQVAMGTLGHERVGTAGLAITMAADLRSMISAAKATNPDALRDPEIRERIARAFTNIEYTKLLNYRALTKIIRGEKNWPEVPLAKLQWSYLAQTLAELAVDLLGPAGLLAKGGPDAVDGGTWSRLYSFQRYTTIGAGATEVQKNIIADRALLPRK